MNSSGRRFLSAALAAIGLTLVAAVGVRVYAQDGPDPRTGRFSWETRVTKTAEMLGVPDLTGTWVVTKREHPVTARICDSHTDSRKLPRNPCRFDASLLHLTDRANAWLNWADERIEGKYYCVPESIPSVLVRAYPVRIEQSKDSITFEHQITIHNTATRTVAMDGRRHIFEGAIPLYYGDSIGKYEGNDLVVDTTNFTFDPNGIDYMTNIPSSWRKHVVERYTRMAPDKLKFVLTFEDPEMMHQPYTETLEMSKVNFEITWTHCDLENADADLINMPPKYKDTK